MSETEVRGEANYAAFVAIDWADQGHVLGHGDRRQRKREQVNLAGTLEAIEAWAVELAVRFQRRVAAVVCNKRAAH